MKFLGSKRFGVTGGCLRGRKRCDSGTPCGILNYEITHRATGSRGPSPDRRASGAAAAPSRPPAWGVRWITFARFRLTQIRLHADH
jgi:hypothetical protein